MFLALVCSAFILRAGHLGTWHASAHRGGRLRQPALVQVVSTPRFLLRHKPVYIRSSGVLLILFDVGHDEAFEIRHFFEYALDVDSNTQVKSSPMF